MPRRNTSSGIKQKEPGSLELKLLLGQLRLLCQSSRPLGFVLLRSVPVWPGLAQTGPVHAGWSGWDQDLWELDESRRGDEASTLGKGTGMDPFSSVGNCIETQPEYRI